MEDNKMYDDKFGEGTAFRFLSNLSKKNFDLNTDVSVYYDDKQILTEIAFQLKRIADYQAEILGIEIDKLEILCKK